MALEELEPRHHDVARDDRQVAARTARLDAVAEVSQELWVANEDEVEVGDEVVEVDQRRATGLGSPARKHVTAPVEKSTTEMGAPEPPGRPKYSRPALRRLRRDRFGSCLDETNFLGSSSNAQVEEAPSK